MYSGRFEGDHRKPAQGTHARKARPHAKRSGGRFAAVAAATVLLLALTIGGTVAWLTTQTGGITNTFLPSSVSCRVTEEFNGSVKSNVNVTNTGDINAYIRVKLVSYRTNDQGQHIGGTAEIPGFTPGEGWVKSGDYYYYTKPVAPGEQPAAALISSLALAASYDDADGGHQSLDVMAEAIQSVPEAAVKAAWGLSIDGNGNLVVSGN